MKRTLPILLVIFSWLGYSQNRDFLDSPEIKIEKTNINSTASDFGPSYVADELWFSAFTDVDINKIRQGKGKEVYYNLFSVPLDGKGNIRGSKAIRLEDISAGYHAGPVSYCEKTGELFVTLSNFKDPAIERVVFRKANIPLKIVILKRSGSSWTAAGEMPFNSSFYSVGHPAISVTGDTLIFASDISGKGSGGADLYMSVRRNGVWGDMVNLGDKINSGGDDMFPFLYKGKYLIYASNGKPGGKGGLDLYYSEITGSGFSTPRNLDQLNSSFDDFGLVIHAGESSGYFVSKREGGAGDDDIYKVIFEPGGNYELELLVRERGTGNPVPNARVNFSDNTSRYTGADGLIRRDLEKETEYTATTALDGYMNESATFTTGGKPYGVLREVLEVEKVQIGQKFEIKNIYYDFDKWDILRESEIELDKLVKIIKDNPSWKVELGSHTDCRGSNAYNDELSQKRSDSAVRYIVSKGIAQSRIIAKGYGESQLVNHCSDGVDCTEAEHRMNRRTEFTILEM